MNLYQNNAVLGSQIETAPDNIGTPLEDAMCAPGPQERVDSCAIRSQQHILSMYGIHISESELVQDAIAHSEYSLDDVSGTSLKDIGNLLERNGLETHRYEGATMAHLISELGQGHKIIVGVDAYEIMADSLEDRIIEMQKDAIAEIPNHALVVVNIDPDTLQVDIVDPADGQLHRVSAEKFVDAWEDSNCFMVSTTKSPEEYISSIGGSEGLLQTNAYNGGTVMSNINIRDIDGNGIADIMEQDINGNGRIEYLAVDTNHDGIPDVTVQSNLGLVNVSAVPNFGGSGLVGASVSSNIDRTISDGDDLTDVFGKGVIGKGIENTFGMDLNGDGTADVFGQMIDVNGDGISDAMLIDINGDGIPDAVGIDIDGNGTIDKVIDINDL